MFCLFVCLFVLFSFLWRFAWINPYRAALANLPRNFSLVYLTYSLQSSSDGDRCALQLRCLARTLLLPSSLLYLLGQRNKSYPTPPENVVLSLHPFVSCCCLSSEILHITKVKVMIFPLCSLPNIYVCSSLKSIKVIIFAKLGLMLQTFTILFS